jgi:demethylmenaquinone methyltransferase/2-methoxy-6-polyprenyl-1,4-benzoquinol methylase
MKQDPRAAYFDSIAERWDGWEDLPMLESTLAAWLHELAIGDAQTVLDVGCGTGNLTASLLRRLSPEGRVVAIDISARMLAVAQGKVDDARVRWLLAAADRLPLPDGCCDAALCYSVWPHFDDPLAVGRELFRVLRPAGRLHVWHLLGRERLNQIHAGAGEAVCGDVLDPAPETAALLEEAGFHVERATEDDHHYLVTGTRASRP